jgi:hypothetical protein
VHGDFTTQRILVMELLAGVPLGRAGAALARTALGPTGGYPGRLTRTRIPLGFFR